MKITGWIMAGSVVQGCTREDGADVMFAPEDWVDRTQIVKHAVALAARYLTPDMELPPEMARAIDRARRPQTDDGNTPET